MTGEALLHVKNLRLSVRSDEGNAQILDHVELTLARGKVLGVVGESGCGKRIGFIPQDPYLALNPVFKIGAQLLAAIRWHAPPELATEAARRAELIRLLRRVQLPEPEAVLERYPHQFSGGQRQRLMIAGALAARPALLIADEPTTALDVTTQLQILKLLKSLTQEFGIGMLFVTHDFGVVAQLCDATTVMYAGQTVETGPTAELLADPRHPYTQALLACHPDRSQVLTGIPGQVPSPLAPPPGCRFTPRCRHAIEVCSRRPAHLVPDAPGHMVSCRLADERQGAVNA